ncbi:solute carrier family 22 member 8-like [Aplysia californica]|uniref:Solute carrier family 22 member 8-like n=1 Tax=Aplysia californica TaxID=6500 RepID=A0ABM0K5T0_APLCA|nr:solute carrier family 22 member 8-like [Aplysia californica]
MIVYEEGDVFGTLTIVATLYALVGGGGCFIGIFFYMPEFFPTNVRNQATGVASAMARLGAMLAPFTGIMMEIAVWLPGLVIGLLASLVACAVTALPETRGRELPQTLDDLKAWYEEDKKKKSDNKLINDTETAA